jgi:hypothetical protein
LDEPEEGKQMKGAREVKLLRGACVQTAFHAKQTQLWPLFDFPSEFIRTAAPGRMATGASVGEMRNAHKIVVGKPERDQAALEN